MDGRQFKRFEIRYMYAGTDAAKLLLSTGDSTGLGLYTD